LISMVFLNANALYLGEKIEDIGEERQEIPKFHIRLVVYDDDEKQRVIIF